jgi:uncharacterized protein YbcI
MEGGEPDRVLEMRRGFQQVMKRRYSDLIEKLTGRRVLTFLSQAHVEPDLTIEVFLMDGRCPVSAQSSSSTRRRPIPATRGG